MAHPPIYSNALRVKWEIFCKSRYMRFDRDRETNDCVWLCTNKNCISVRQNPIEKKKREQVTNIFI